MKIFDYFLYALTIFAWSTSWLPLRWQLGVVAPEVSLFWRFLFAGAVMMLVTRALGHSLRLPLAIHARVAVLSLFLFSFNFVCFYYGGMGLASGLLAVVFSTASLVVLLQKALIEWRLPQWRLVFAASLGISGVALIFLPELRHGQAPLISLGFCLLGVMIFSFGNILSGRLQSKSVSVFSSSSWGMCYGAVYLGIIALVKGDAFIMEQSWTYLGGLAWLVLVATILAFSCYLTLLGRIGAERASYITVLFPIFALLISQQAEAFAWTYFSLIGLACVVAGNTIMARKTTRA